MKILFLGDIVGEKAVEELGKRLGKYKTENKIDFVIANGENASKGNGLCKNDAEAILSYGVDVITSGNHIWQKNDLRGFLDDCPNIIRPANYPGECAGKGYTIADCNGYRILVMNVCGTVFSEPLGCPFEAVSRMLKEAEGKYDMSFLDVHAEATSEKAAIARYFDGKINGVVGTHTHVMTADEKIFPGGTGFITDLGMCGPTDSILGVKSEIVIEKLRTKMPARFEFADGEIEFQGVEFVIDADIGKSTTQQIKRIKF